MAYGKQSPKLRGLKTDLHTYKTNLKKAKKVVSKWIWKIVDKQDEIDKQQKHEDEVMGR